MTTLRENTLRAIRFERPDYIPMQFSISVTRRENAMPLGDGRLFTRLGDDMARAMTEMMKKQEEAIHGYSAEAARG